MSLVRTFDDARAALEIGADATPREVKRAYRRMTVAHPPDRDPEGFRRVREAYELLREPALRALEMLSDRKPAVPPPHLDLPRAPRGATATALLRHIASQADAAALLGIRRSDEGQP